MKIQKIVLVVNFILILGNVSEDLLRDGRKSFENGLPPDGDYDAYSNELEYTSWGVVPNTQVVVNAFNNNLSSRQFQDIGFDGLSDNQELSYFNNYVSKIQNHISDPNIISKIMQIHLEIILIITEMMIMTLKN